MDSEESLRRLAFVWGVHGVVLPEIAPTDDAFQIVESVMKQFRGIGDGATIVITAGVPTLGRGTTNMVKVHRIGQREVRKI
jgi:pyruvate kinase